MAILVQSHKYQSVNVSKLFLYSGFLHDCVYVATVMWEEGLTCHVRLYDVYVLLLLEMDGARVAQMWQ